MARALSNWLDSYVDLHFNTEPATIFHLWTGYSIIAATLRRKISLQLGRLVYHPNIYVVFVAEPGVARKTQAINFGIKFLDTIPDIKVSSDSATKEAMTDDVEGSALDELMPTGETLRHSSLNIISREFESFLGQKKENTRMLTALTDLYDCPENWSSRTRHGTSNKIIRPWVNLLAATTPESLASSLPSTAVGGGLTSRVLFVWADKKAKSVAIPSTTPEEDELRGKLERDLYMISRMSGQFSMTKECRTNWIDWYVNFNEDEDGNRICKDKSFNGWYSRKPSMIMKVSMLCAAAESNQTILQWHQVQRAIRDIEQVEKVMGNAFKAMGKSEISSLVDDVHTEIKRSEIVSEKQLMSLFWRDMDSQKFDVVMETLVKTGTVRREYIGPNKEKGIWYRAI